MGSRRITKLLRNLGLVFSSRFPFINYPMLKPTAQRQTTAPKMQETEPDVNCHGPCGMLVTTPHWTDPVIARRTALPGLLPHMTADTRH